MERVKRLQGKVITKSLSNKMEENLKKHEGKYYFSEDDSEEEEKKESKEEQEEKKELIIETNLTINKTKNKDEPQISKGSVFPIQIQEHGFKAVSNNKGQYENKDKLEEGKTPFSLFNISPNILPGNEKNNIPKEPVKDLAEPKIKKSENFNFNYSLSSASNQVTEPNTFKIEKPITGEALIEKNVKGAEKKVKTELQNPVQFNFSSNQLGSNSGLGVFQKIDPSVEPKKETTFKISQSPEKKLSEEGGLGLSQKKNDIKDKEESNIVQNQNKSQGGLFGNADISLGLFTNTYENIPQGGFFSKPVQGGGLFGKIIENKNEKEISVPGGAEDNKNKSDAIKPGFSPVMKPNIQENKLPEAVPANQNQNLGLKGNGKTDEANALHSAPISTQANSQSTSFFGSSLQPQPQPQPQPRPQSQPQSKPQLQPQPQIQPQATPAASLFFQQNTINKTNVPANLFGSNNFQNNNNKNLSNFATATPSFPAFGQPQPGNQPQGQLNFGKINKIFI